MCSCLGVNGNESQCRRRYCLKCITSVSHSTHSLNILNENQHHVQMMLVVSIFDSMAIPLQLERYFLLGHHNQGDVDVGHSPMSNIPMIPQKSPSSSSVITVMMMFGRMTMSGIPLHSHLSAGSTVYTLPPLAPCSNTAILPSSHALQGCCIALDCITLDRGHSGSSQERTPDQSDLTSSAV